MATLNKVQLIGYLGADPEIKKTTNGHSVASVNLATSYVFKNNLGNTETNTEWHRLVFWGNLADNLSKFTQKGSMLYVEGRLQTREWTKDDVRRFSTEIVVVQMQFLDRKEKDTSATSSNQYNPDAEAYNKTSNASLDTPPTSPSTTPKQDDDFIEDDIPF